MFDYPIAVRESEIDHMGHVNNASYLSWVQNAVVAHWEARATPQQVLKHLWVALRHEIDYRNRAFWRTQSTRASCWKVCAAHAPGTKP